MKLYVYDHCPFCIRSRMIFGLKNVTCEVVCLPNDDEATPTELIGKKMLPILVNESRKPLGESLDIVKYIDETYGSPAMTVADNAAIESWMENATGTIFRLAVPRWSKSDFTEFNAESSRQYFIDKKEAVFGDFTALMNESPALIADANQQLRQLDELLAMPDEDAQQWSLTDIRLFPLLRSLSIVKGIEWPAKVEAWRQNMAAQSNINLHDDIAI